MAILERPEIKTYRSCAFPSRTFSMDQTPEAFMALSSLYSDRIKAVVREIGTNARDAHIAAGKPDVRFLAHLPNLNDPTFWVRDFGVSLPIRLVTGEIEFDPNTGDPIDNTDDQLVDNYSNVEEFLQTLIDEAVDVEYVADGIIIDGIKHKIIDDAMVLYTTYFRSTKRGNNDETGQLGLGSKSPFAYTDSFQVVVYYNGEKRTYALLLNDDGIPEVNLIDSLTGPTDEPDGVYVCMDAKYGDFSSFERAALEIYRDFDVRPIMDWTGLADEDGDTEPSDHLKYKEYDKFLEGDGWFLAHNLNNAYIRMGGVRYRLDQYAAGIDEVNRKILGMNIMIDCPNGSIDFVPSREAPKYTKKTVTYLNQRLAEIRHGAELSIRATLDNSKNLWEARCWSNDLLLKRDSKLSVMARICKIQDVEYKGTSLGRAEIDISEVKHIEVTRFTREAVRGRYYSFQGWKAIRGDNPRTVVPTHRTMFVLDDLTRGVQGRIRHLVKNQPEKEEDCTVDRVYVIKCVTREARDKFLETIGFPAEDLVKASSLERPDIVSRSGGHTAWATNAKVFVHNGGSNQQRLIDYWNEKEMDLSTGGVYVELHRYKAKRRGVYTPCNPMSITEICDQLKSVGLPVPEVVGVRPSVAKHFVKSDIWIDFWEHVETLVRNAVIDEDIAAKIQRHRLSTMDEPDNKSSWNVLTNTFKPKYVDSPMGRFAKMWQDVWNSETFKTIDKWNRLCQSVKIVLDDTTLPAVDFGTEIKVILSTYPMIDAIFTELWSSRLELKSVRQVHEYCHMIDQLNNLEEISDEG